MMTDAEQRRAYRARTMATRREAVDHRWRMRDAAANRPAIARPDPEPGTLDGQIGLVRMAAILLAAALLGAGWAKLENTIDPPAVIGPQA